MTEISLESFESMEEVVERKTGVKRRFFPKAPAIYVCTVCGKIRAPTSDKNVRCERCDSPLIESLENIQVLQKMIKETVGFPELVAQIRGRIRKVRALRMEFAEAKSTYRRNNTDYGREEVRPTHKSKGLLVFKVTVAPNKLKKWPQGYQGTCKIPEMDLEKFQALMKKHRIPYYMVGTEKEVEQSNNLREVMIEAQDNE